MVIILPFLSHYYTTPYLPHPCNQIINIFVTIKQKIIVTNILLNFLAHFAVFNFKLGVFAYPPEKVC